MELIMKDQLENYLSPSEFIQSDHPLVAKFVADNTDPSDSPSQKAIKLFHAVRDQIKYDPDTFSIKREFYYPAVTLHKKASTCVPKAALLCAVLRNAGVPCKMGYADVTNHIISPKILDLLNGNKVFYMHGFCRLYLNYRWIKVTPTFNKELCEKMRVAPLEFDGENDCLFQQYNSEGNKLMEYITYYDEFEDIPFDYLTKLYLESYPKLCSVGNQHSFDFYKNIQ